MLEPADIGSAVVLLSKAAATAPELSYALHGELQACKSGWVLLQVPNDLVRGAFDALHVIGAELPEDSETGRLNAHISVMRPEELAAVGLTANDIKERGHRFAYTLGPVRSVKPAGWGEVSKCWFITCRSPELEKLRKSYGLTPIPHNNEYDFHITIAVKKKVVVDKAAAAASEHPVASVLYEPERWAAQAAAKPLRVQRPELRTNGGRWGSAGGRTSKAPPPTPSKEAAALRMAPQIAGRWLAPAAAAALMGAVGVNFYPPAEGDEHLLPVDDEAQIPGGARYNGTLRWPKKFKWAADGNLLDVVMSIEKVADQGDPGEDCPHCGASLERDPDSGRCNSCGEDWPEKQAALKPGVTPQPHQARIHAQAASGDPLRTLLYHQVGSGKSLSAIGAAESVGGPYTAVTPAALRENFRKEQDKFTDMTTPSQVVSYTSLARSGAKPYQAQTVAFDEAHRLREPGSQQSMAAADLADKARNVILMTGTPIVNRPSDLAHPLSMLTRTPMSPEMFDERYVGREKVDPGFWGRLQGIKPGERLGIKNEDDLAQRFRGHVDYHAPAESGVDVTDETHSSVMSPEQHALYKSFWGQLPFHARWKMERQFPLSREEQRNLQHFLSGPRQVGLSTLPFMRGTADPLKAFQQSPKLQQAAGLLEEALKDPKKKAIIYSNFIGAGLQPYSAALTDKGIPHGMFNGAMTDAERKKVVNDYNADKLRVMLLGPAGAEGLSLKGTRLTQLLDPHWNETRLDQAIGRGLRFDSHTHLPEDERNMVVQRFNSDLPPGALSQLSSLFGMTPKPRPGADAALNTMSDEKARLNQSFLDLLKRVGSEEPTPPSGKRVIERLQAAKALSDAGRYNEKHTLLQQLMQAAPRDWIIDDPRGRHVGVTHTPTNFRLHMDRSKMPSGIGRAA